MTHVPSNKQITKVLIRLRICAGWSVQMRRLVCTFVICKPPKTGFLASRPKLLLVTIYMYRFAYPISSLSFNIPAKGWFQKLTKSQIPCLTLCLLVASADNLFKQSGAISYKTDLDPNCLTPDRWYSCKNFRKSWFWKKISRQQLKHEKLPSRQSVKVKVHVSNTSEEPEDHH